MATWDDVRRAALALPEVMERANGHGKGVSWQVHGLMFAWERPLRHTEIEALESAGAEVPEVPILAARVPDLEVKESLIAQSPDVYFTAEHFDGHRAVLVKLPSIGEKELAELLAEAWLCRAPKRLAKQWLDERGDRT